MIDLTFPPDAVCTACAETWLDENGLRHSDLHPFVPATTTDAYEALRDDDGEPIHVPECGCTRCTGGRHAEAATFYVDPNC